MSRVFRELLEAVVLAVIVFLLIQTSIRNFKVDGKSMDPTLEDGQYLMVNKLVYFQLDMARLSRIVPFWKVDNPSVRFAAHSPRRGEVIVFHSPPDPSKDFVKRVIGLPGERVELQGGDVYIDGERLSEDYIKGKKTQCHPATKLECPVILAEKEYFVLGDNRDASNDSRRWGAVSESEVLGKVWFVYWPVASLQILNSLPRGIDQAVR